MVGGTIMNNASGNIKNINTNIYFFSFSWDYYYNAGYINIQKKSS